MIATKRELYAVGLVLAPEGGAFVVVEKRPRSTGRVERVRRADGTEIEETWEDVLVLVVAERLIGRMTEMVDLAAEYLAHEPLKGDSVAFVESSLLGETVGRMLAERGAGVGRIVIAGDVEAFDPTTGVWSVAPAILQARVTLAFETARLAVLDDLAEGVTVLRALERIGDLPERGPARDLGLAAAIAVWAGDKYPSNGPWASSKEPPLGSRAAEIFEEQNALREVAREERASRRRGAWLRAALRGESE